MRRATTILIAALLAASTAHAQTPDENTEAAGAQRAEQPVRPTSAQPPAQGAEDPSSPQGAEASSPTPMAPSPAQRTGEEGSTVQRAEGAEAPTSPAGTPEGQPMVPRAEGGEAGALPAGHPTVGAAPPGAPHSGLPDVLSAPNLSSAEPSGAIPAGTIRVRVVDAQGNPVPDVPVNVGVLAQGDRSRHNGRSDAQGIATFADLPTGSGQAYRVNVPSRGATYGSTPFRLPTDQGYDVRITRLPVTEDDRFVFFHIFRVVIELKDERLHVIHQVELTNAGQDTYAFPASGLRASLPEGATAFQAQRIMTDQRVEELPDDGGYAIRGSLPPGTVQMAWAYDVPVEGESMRIPIDVPLHFFGLQVFSEAPEGLVMNVAGMPDPQRVDNEGQPLWVTQMRRGPSDAPLEQVTVTISGIPGPGPLRWIAVVLALAFVLGGVFLFVQGGDPREATARARRQRREELLAEARELEADFEIGEIGPEYRQKRREEIVRALAVLLHEEEAAREQGAKPAGRPAPSVR